MADRLGSASGLRAQRLSFIYFAGPETSLPTGMLVGRLLRSSGDFCPVVTAKSEAGRTDLCRQTERAIEIFCDWLIGPVPLPRVALWDIASQVIYRGAVPARGVSMRGMDAAHKLRGTSTGSCFGTLPRCMSLIKAFSHALILRPPAREGHSHTVNAIGRHGAWFSMWATVLRPT